MAAISLRRAKASSPPSRREHKPGRLMVGKIVRFYPEELARIEKVSRRLNLASSRFIGEAALDRATAPRSNS